jgi:hypothetical protein
MEPLGAHQDRTEEMREALERLLAIHKQVHDLHRESLLLAAGSEPDKVQRIEALRDEANRLLPEVDKLREILIGPTPPQRGNA